MIKACLNCNFYKRFEENELYGECRRYPPTKNVSDKSSQRIQYGGEEEPRVEFYTSSFLIQVNNVDWCGEWKEMDDYDRLD